MKDNYLDMQYDQPQFKATVNILARHCQVSRK